MPAHIERAQSGGPSPWNDSTDLKARILAAQAAGVSTIVNLLPEPESGKAEEMLAASLGIQYISIPVRDEEDCTFNVASKLRSVLEEPAYWPVLVHCDTGDRVGALMALDAYRRMGVSALAAVEIGKLYGLSRFTRVVLERIGPSP